MRFFSTFFSVLTLTAVALLAGGCAGSPSWGGGGEGALVISELMPDNRTGLAGPKGKPQDWVEICNLSGDSIDTEGWSIEVAKSQDAKDTENSATLLTRSANSQNSGFAAPNGVSVFFVKLPKDSGTVRLLNPKGRVVSEVHYAGLAADQSLQRLDDSTYVASDLPSPGFENTREGYEAACAAIDAQRTGPLLIWELMARTGKSHTNWVELKNVSDTVIDLSGYGLSKRFGKGDAWPLPKRTLAPGQVVTVQLAGRRANRFNPLHANFKLGNAETVVLSKDGKFVDAASAKRCPIGASVGRAVGKAGFFYYASPTPGADNGGNGRRYIAPMPQFDQRAGIYKNKKKICLRLGTHTPKIHYTLDGSEPTMSSPVFRDSIVLTGSCVVRAFAEGDSVSLRSPVAKATYLLGVSHDMAVINVSVDNADLYDYNRGIYANGPGYSPQWPHLGANFWKSWTRDAHVEFFDGKQGFAADCGLKIFGGYSRYEAKKSFCLKFKHRYGVPSVTYDFFGQGELELQDLVLRSGSQDYNRCMVRDEFFTSLMKPQCPELLIQDYRPVALYINAQYFGLYYIREKIDRNFVARQLGVSNDSITILMSIGYNEEGSSIPYKQLLQYISSHDMADSTNYNHVRAQVDLHGLIDWKLGQIYSANTDVGNIRYVRSTDAESDKKWHFVFYDLDATWVGNRPTAEHYLSMGGSAAAASVTAHNVMINRLLTNKDFRQLFLQRLSLHLHKTFSAKNATSVFDKLVKRIRPEMKRNCERWPQLGFDTWEKNIAAFREKFATKPKAMLDDLRAYLSITDAENKKYFGDLGY